ncbi:extracellular solute-binding protein [Sporolactobacillus shoreae]|uniref:Extracellular solute-binding protein n=1 Tax=Sporolactobacillus shoreae TaxID=1465501 RepID=A0A4Z0GU83_9BACL|nr:extracellular solute-binding protein [Sporolactobacillus shoreae]TGA99828.1 extracellular solute-binding protein [Sporolactobacillus shoreae]
MKRLWLGTMLATMFIFTSVLSGCAGAGSQSGNGAKGTEISAIVQDRWAPYVKKAVSIWNSEHPKQKVNLNMLVVGYPQLYQKLTTSAAGGNTPDFSLIDSVWVTEFAKNGYLQPLDSIDPSWVKNDYDKDFYPALIKGDSYQGHPYAIHTQTDMVLLWYRKDWFKNEGLQPPKTWQDLTSDAKYFAQKNIEKKYGNTQGIAFQAGVKAGETTTSQILPFLWSNGADVLKNGQVVLNSKNTIQSMQMLNNLVKDGSAPADVTTYDWNTSLQLFAKGKTAISVGGSYEKASIQQESGWSDAQFKQKVGFVPVPAGPNGKPSTQSGGMDYVIYKSSQNQKLDLSILKLITGPKLMKDFLVETQQNSPRISVTKSFDPKKQWFLKETGNYLYNAETRPSSPVYSKVSTQLQNMIEDSVSGNTSAGTAVSNAASAISQVTGLKEKSSK